MVKCVQIIVIITFLVAKEVPLSIHRVKFQKKGGDKNFITILESNSFIYSMGWKLLQNGDVQLDKNAKVAAYEAYSCRSI